MQIRWMFPLGVLAALAGCRDMQRSAEGGPETRPADVQDLIQRRPVRNLEAIYLNGFQHAADDIARQSEVNLYCHKASDELYECVLVDVQGKVTGVEHIISRDRFDGLPEEEQRRWHPYNYLVKSGLLIAPGLSTDKEHQLMKELVSMYGKSFSTYAEPGAELPSGTARLMKTFTGQGQASTSLVDERDRRFKVDSSDARTRRADIEGPGFDPIVLQEEPPAGTTR
jgi:Protein of unknown function (DUF1264)